MLLRFEVSNHRSIGPPVELSMIAVDGDRPAARSFDLLNERVLTVAGIYGPNASGKSNVVDALLWLSNAVARSLRAWEDVVPRQPFKFQDAPELASTFEVEMMVGGVRYIYQVALTDKEIITEGLYSYPERRRRSLFERAGMDIQFRRGLGSPAGTRELLTPTTLALSAAMRFDEPEIGMFGRELANVAFIGPRRYRSRPIGRPSLAFHSTERIFFGVADSGEAVSTGSDPVERSWNASSALELLRFADLGIDDVEVVEEPTDETLDTTIRRRQVRLVHRVGHQQVPFGRSDESDGTLTWFSLIGPVLRALQTGRIILLDEIDASLHPRLSAKLLELFQDTETNPRGAQLIFTSHDTSLLNHLNRDEVWLTEKGPDGATTLTALAEYSGDRVRKSLNLERAYLQGRFGAVPELDQELLRRALGVPPGDS